jgi:CRISPR-associated protein Cas8a1/Csx13
MTGKSGPRDGPGSLTVRLFGPGMTALHRVGLAGLAMTLRALEADGTAARLAARGAWEVTDQTVTLRWRGEGAAFFGDLLKASFRLTPSGLIWFAGLGDPAQDWEISAVLHNAMLRSFLQHGPTTRVSRGKVTSINVGDDEEPVVIRFQPLGAYKHQGVALGKKQALRFDGVTPLEVAGWLYPGGVVRHNQAPTTALMETPDRALALIYAPVGAIFFEVHRRTAGVRPEYSVVLPAVRDVTAYTEAREGFARGGAARLQVSGVAEAAARVLADFEARRVLRVVDTDRCTVIAFGTVPWSKQQKTRVDLFEVRDVKTAGLQAYQAASHALVPRKIEGKPDKESGLSTYWWSVPQTPDLVAENVVHDAPWWRGFAGMWARVRAEMQGEERRWALWGEQEGLHMMVGDRRVMPDGAEANLVRACHEAWRRRLGELGERARDTGTPFERLAEREYERVRISFARCKNAAMLRRTLTDFWSRSGAQPALQEGWMDVLPLLSRRWQEARDLALLALASYRGTGAAGANASTAAST